MLRYMSYGSIKNRIAVNGCKLIKERIYIEFLNYQIFYILKQLQNILNLIKFKIGKTCLDDMRIELDTV